MPGLRSAVHWGTARLIDRAIRRAAAPRRAYRGSLDELENLERVVHVADGRLGVASIERSEEVGRQLQHQPPEQDGRRVRGSTLYRVAAVTGSAMKHFSYVSLTSHSPFTSFVWRNCLFRYLFFPGYREVNGRDDARPGAIPTEAVAFGPLS